MMKPLRANWEQLQEKTNALSVRERAIIGGAIAVLLLGIFDQLLLRPWLQERESITKEQQKIRASSEQLSLQLTELEAQLANDPNRVLQDKIAQLLERHRRLDADIARITDGMIAPEKMPALLGELLSERSGLKVQSIKTFPARQLLTTEQGGDEAPAIYRHDLELRLQGSYAQVQRYLESIESLQETLVWDVLDFTMEQYPRGELLLAVHTLSAREELIRVGP
ncbi:MAG: hypothetical protein R3F38_16690 [Gammaproteobacteria bacterium]